ncbi:tripartite tricarboxylate transporter substrate-binding protein [Nocardiopsis sp. ARC36]
MTVVLAHAPVESAEAAFAQAVRQAGLQGGELVIANAVSDDAAADTRAADESRVRELVGARRPRGPGEGRTPERRRRGGRPPGTHRGAGRRPARHRGPPPLRDRQAAHGQHGPAPAPGGVVPRARGEVRSRAPQSGRPRVIGDKGLLGAGIGLALVVTTGFFAVQDAAGGDEGSRARSALTVIAPAAAGGGWDLAAREFQQATRTESIVNNVQVVNVPGAGGTIGLGQLARLDGEPTTVMVTGAAMVGGVEMGGSPVRLSDVTPIARLTDDFEVIAVPADSPWQTLDDFLRAWEEDPDIPWAAGRPDRPTTWSPGSSPRPRGWTPPTCTTRRTPGAGS